MESLWFDDGTPAPRNNSCFIVLNLLTDAIWSPRPQNIWNTSEIYSKHATAGYIHDGMYDNISSMAGKLSVLNVEDLTRILTWIPDLTEVSDHWIFAGFMFTDLGRRDVELVIHQRCRTFVSASAELDACLCSVKGRRLAAQRLPTAEALIRAVWIQQGLKRTNDVGKYRKKWRCARDTKVGCEVDGMPRWTWEQWKWNGSFFHAGDEEIDLLWRIQMDFKHCNAIH